MSRDDALRVESEISKLIAEAGKLQAETAKLIAETGKMRMERLVAPMIASSGMTLAIVAAVKLFL